jgi:4-amino-4-deoxy-L-arabinose transferase-like glycosyltransferase
MLLAIVVAGLAVRAIVLWLSGPSTLRFGDAASYLDAAATLCTEGRYPWTSNLPNFRAPGLPFFLAAATACHPECIPWAKATLALLDAGTIVLAFSLARALELGRRAALLAAALVALHPFLLLSSSDVTSEPLATFLVAAWLTAIAWGWRDRGLGLGLWLAAGVAAGLAGLTRPSALLCVPLGVAAVAVARSRGARTMALRAAALCVGAVLVVAPWSLVASRAAGGFVLVNDAGGYVFWRGVHPDLARASASGDTETLLRESLRFELETSPRVAAEVARAAATPAERNALWRRLALEAVREDPRAALAFTLTRARGYWRPWPDRSVSPTWFVVAGAAILAPVLAGGVVGIVRRRRTEPRQALFFAALLVVPWLAQLPYQMVSRFRIPFTEVILCVLAASVAVDVADRLRRRARATR